MKIFISHKKEDEQTALNVQRTLTQLGVNAYLDILDDIVTDDGKALTDHIKEKLGECTDVIVVLSNYTKKSWWVPFEIGMASNKDMPIANYLLSNEELPGYLSYWPRLKGQQDIKKYVEIRNKISNQVSIEKSIYESVYNKASETQRFYAELKRNL